MNCKLFAEPIDDILGETCTLEMSKYPGILIITHFLWTIKKKVLQLKPTLNLIQIYEKW